jgi:glycerol-3-phosphate dehydrogenase (NAD(P)+)|uniref:Multifunctional fusion protein n=1 Tax=candidate division WOR-3 bacterium TaxID=2052148 RepID=A0A7C3YSD5_UNCW3
MNFPENEFSLFVISSSRPPNIFLSLFFGYILGGIPFGYLLPLRKGIDIRKYGSKNIGFTNVLRNLGLGFALPVFFLDFAKGFLPTLFARSLLLDPIFVGLGAVLGHLFTPFLSFRGGKGVSTTFGVLFALSPKISLIGALIWIGSFLLFSYASLSSLLFSLLLLLSPFLFSIPAEEKPIFFFIPFLIIIKHLPNIKRLLTNSEPKTHFRKKKTSFSLSPSSLLFIGAGRWAQSLSLTLAPKVKRIILWEGKREKGMRSKEIPEEIPFPENIQFTNSFIDYLKDSPILFFSLPTSALREVLEKFSRAIPKETIIISTVKGIEKDTLKLPSQIILSYLSQNPILVLAGPGIPYEIAQKKPSALVLATKDISLGKEIQRLFSGETLRIYLSQDPIGVELGGALKNVIAIACGIIDGKGWGINAKSSLITRGLSEMKRIAVFLGAQPETLNGLSGIGDLILTSFSPHSRNYRLGWEIGQGKKVAEAKEGISGVIEGLETCVSVYQLAKRYNLNLPIMEEIYKILYEGEEPEISLRRLMLRDLKGE